MFVAFRNFPRKSIQAFLFSIQAFSFSPRNYFQITLSHDKFIQQRLKGQPCSPTKTAGVISADCQRKPGPAGLSRPHHAFHLQPSKWSQQPLLDTEKSCTALWYHTHIPALAPSSSLVAAPGCIPNKGVSTTILACTPASH